MPPAKPKKTWKQIANRPMLQPLPDHQLVARAKWIRDESSNSGYKCVRQAHHGATFTVLLSEDEKTTCKLGAVRVHGK